MATIFVIIVFFLFSFLFRSPLLPIRNHASKSQRIETPVTNGLSFESHVVRVNRRFNLRESSV